MGPVLQRLRVLAWYATMRLRARMAYRGDFAVQALGDLLVASIGLVFLWSVFSHVPDIAGWSFHEVLFIWGMAEATTGIFFVFFQGLWSQNQRYILGGELDRLLLRPIDPYVQLLLDNLKPEDLPVALLGCGMMAMALPGLPALSLAQWFMLPVFLLAGVGVLAGVLTGISAIGFRVHHRGTAIGLVYQASVFARYPLTVFPRSLQVLLVWVLPFAFISFLPASWFLGREEWLAFAMVQPIVGLACASLGLLTWRRGLSDYRSTGT